MVYNAKAPYRLANALTDHKAEDQRGIDTTSQAIPVELFRYLATLSHSEIDTGIMQKEYEQISNPLAKNESCSRK